MKNFLLLANDPALDLLNTTPVLADGPVDLLSSFTDLTQWAAASGLIGVAAAETLRQRFEGTPIGAGALAATKNLREALRDIVKTIASDKPVPPAALDSINAALQQSQGRIQLQWNPKKHLFVRAHRRDVDGTAQEIVAAIADAGVRLLTEKSLSLIRKCENPACVLHFYDTSKNHGRRWCSMEICGNRLKVAAHYRRQKQAEER
jgi:predicted RNA-binding Zn ribbon-like protein